CRNGVKPAEAERLGRLDVRPAGLEGERRARVDGAPVERDRARPAGAAVADALAAGDVEVVAATSRWLRGASSSVTRGSTLVTTFLPLTVSSSTTGAGPRAGAPVGGWAAAGGASSAVRPATAAAAAPVPVRKPRRDTPRGSPWESFMTHDPRREWRSR